MHTKTVSKTTNITMAIAGVALLGSIQLALAAAALPVAPAQKAGACLATITSATRACRGGFRDYVFACPNGLIYSVPTLCRSRVSAQNYANSICKKKNMCGAPAAAAPAAPVVVNNYPDIGFSGQPVFYTDSEGVPKVKIAYKNIGQQALPQEYRRQYSIHMTYLDANKQPIGLVQSTSLYPLGPGEVGYLAMRVGEDGAFALKFRLDLGLSPQDNHSLDGNTLNNETSAPVPQGPFPFGVDPAPAQYADLVVSNVVVDSSASSSVSITLKNQGNALSKLTGESLKVGFRDVNHTVLSSQLFVLPNIAPGDIQRVVVPVNLDPRPATLFVSIDPDRTGNEPKFMEPNIMRENNEWSGPVFTPPSVAWGHDTPSGIVAPQMGQTIGKFVIWNQLNEGFPLSVHYFTFNINTNIRYAEGSRPMLRVYKDSVATQPLIETVFDPEMRVYRLDDIHNLLVSSGASKTIIVTLDTMDARSNNTLSITLSPTNGMNWTMSDSWNSVFLNSEALRPKTLTY